MDRDQDFDRLMVKLGTRCTTCEGQGQYVPQGGMLPKGCTSCEGTGAQHRKWVPLTQLADLISAHTLKKIVEAAPSDESEGQTPSTSEQTA